MQYALLVNASPFGSVHTTALAFARALTARGHTLSRVFFYAEGVHTANALQQPPQGETSAASQWQQLAHECGCELVVCIAAALRRGVLDADEAKRYEKSAHNLLPGFSLRGLGDLVEAGIGADKVVSFG